MNEGHTQAIRDPLIADGIAEVEIAYAEGDPRRIGSLEGFELCRSLLNRQDFERVLNARDRREIRRAFAKNEPPGQDEIDDYWRHRYATLQIEWVMKCLLVVWGEAWVSGRALSKVLDVVQQLATEEGESE